MLQFKKFDADSEGEPIARIVDTLLAYAIRDGAHEIHLRQSAENQGFTVYYQLSEDAASIEQMKMPVYVSQPLKSHLQNLVGEDGSYEIKFVAENHAIFLTYTLMLDVQPAPHSETIVLKLKGPGKNPA